MIKSELLKKIEKAKDDEDINSLLVGTDIEETFKGEEPTLDVFKGKIKSDKVFQQFMDSERDTYHSKALKTMKEKGTWENEFSNELKTKYPELITDPKDKQMMEMQKQIDEMKAKEDRQNLFKKALSYAQEKKYTLSNRSIEKCLKDDWESTIAEIDSENEDWSKGIESVVEQKMKVNSYIPGIGGEGDPVSIGASIAAKANSTSSVPSDPWATK
ncbi:DUF4355 domain-containing protein [Clostridium botulinum]|uniref:DUF4355 domain-containing protein n=2 Tax=Clostridium botulinum TaxID=1491 RepID=UPI0013F74D64|nr:DUF4355 domain-containing protein [Clostridium botulinum]MBY6915410.1 DUF4355 domain-containing protein [Clostridium botulinum]NFO48523.1 DUF4355 domain-containing protein [Clostridium botulinum]NFQ37698.1 DUF4355 domain-containing protein [Clostridium botulinum]